MPKKTFYGPIELKQDGQEGEFRAVFATLGVVDLDEDYTESAAFTDGQEAIIEPYNHSWDLPAGKGIVRTDGKAAWIDGRFFLDTQAGQENYKTVKNLGDLAQWSYTFNILDSEFGQAARQVGAARILKSLDVIGVSPVTRGAGVDTRTAMIKGHKTAIPFRATETTDSDWDGPANEARLRNDESADYYRRAYAWVDPDGDPDTKAAYRFIHHMVDSEGNIGPANIRACQTGIGVLNGGRVGTTIPDSDRQGVYNHLAGHITDADLEPPELKAVNELDNTGDQGAGGAESNGESTEGKPKDQGAGGAESSGPGPEVIKTKIKLLELEE